METKRPRIGSAVLVVYEGKFLLGKRNKKNYNGKWVIPGGGVNWGETIKDAGIREIKEETDIDIEIMRPIGYKEIINLPGEYHSVVFFHLAKPITTKITVSDDLSDAGFFSVEEMHSLDLAESVIEILKETGYWE